MKIQVKLRVAQRKKIEKFMKRTSSRISALRCRILLLLHRGVSAQETAAICGCARATVYRTLYRFNELGELGIWDLRRLAGPHKVTGRVLDLLWMYLGRTPRELNWQRSNWTLELLSLQLRHDCGVALSPSYIGRLLKKMGCRRGRPRAALRIPVRGRRRILKRIERLAASASPQAEVFYADEADIDLNPRIGLCYCRPGEQPLVLTPGKNQKRYVAAALNARTGTIVHVADRRKNSALFISLLRELARRYRRCQTIHVILDNYIIHKSQRTRRALKQLGGKIQLHFLPPYSPESNPIERLWKQMHDHVTRNHRFADMDSLFGAVEEFLAAAQPFPGTQVSTMRAA